jgi:predicted Zn-dependent peptidase
MNKNNNQPTATIMAIVNVGSNWEIPEINGIAHFLEHLFFKGTKKRPTQRGLALELEKYGAISN